MRDTVRGLEIIWRRLEDGSPLIGKTLSAANLRAGTGASVIAIIWAQQAMPNPKSSTRFGSVAATEASPGEGELTHRE